MPLALSPTTSDFVTTIHSDFKQFDVQKKIVHAPFNDTSFVDQNNNKFEAKSVNKQDFVKWENYKVPTRRKQMQAFVSSQDERYVLICILTQVGVVW